MRFHRKLPLPADAPEQARGRCEFEEAGEKAIRLQVEQRSFRSAAQLRFAVQWLRKQELKRQAREQTTHWATISTLTTVSEMRHAPVLASVHAVFARSRNRKMFLLFDDVSRDTLIAPSGRRQRAIFID
jgi:hypothetical protein